MSYNNPCLRLLISEISYRSHRLTLDLDSQLHHALKEGRACISCKRMICKLALFSKRRANTCHVDLAGLGHVRRGLKIAYPE